MLDGGLGADWIRLDGRSSRRCSVGGGHAPRTERERVVDQAPSGSAPHRLLDAVRMISWFQDRYSPARLSPTFSLTVQNPVCSRREEHG